MGFVHWFPPVPPPPMSLQVEGVLSSHLAPCPGTFQLAAAQHQIACTPFLVTRRNLSFHGTWLGARALTGVPTCAICSVCCPHPTCPLPLAPCWRPLLQSAFLQSSGEDQPCPPSARFARCMVQPPGESKWGLSLSCPTIACWKNVAPQKIDR